ncbi:hypothetical protein GGE12_007161 [Rhizobium mongolense]|uniref:Uncharacterized protein n=1 Tax=Rhizobium mongolense TaxID=57676 RepID=A0A7W6RVR8_9HYPH|nr:hypothetical protein [Rhizobium mongolense]
MCEFNRMTIVAAAEVISDSHSHSDIDALMSRMHPHGGHPGLSEEEDATFRLQINLVTARLFLRRLDRGPY